MERRQKDSSGEKLNETHAQQDEIWKLVPERASSTWKYQMFLGVSESSNFKGISSCYELSDKTVPAF